MGIIYTPPGNNGDITNASNTGASGVGVFLGKVLDVLTFKKFRSVDNNLTVTDNVGDSTIDIDVNVKAGIIFGMSGAAITTGVKRRVVIPYACTIQKVSLESKEVGDIVLDVLKNGSSICASAKPTLTNDDSYEDATLTGWTTTITAGDKLSFEVESIADLTEFDLVLWVEKT